MNLKADLLRGIYEYGFERPSAFQQHAIMPIIKGSDVIAQAQSGTGKTAAFCISTLQKIDPDLKACQALILAPSRERAHHIQDVIVNIDKNIECYTCVGGNRIKDDINTLQERPPSVIVGTPGRICDMIQRGALCTDSIKMFVLDEADEALSRGFTEHIHEIFNLLPRSTSTQFVLLSATMPQDVLEVTTKFMRDPVRIKVDSCELRLKGIKQFYITFEDEQEDTKVDCLCDLFKAIPNKQTVIFCNKRKKVEWLTDQLTARDIAVTAIHFDMQATQRADIMREFYSGSHILIATDMLARGLNVQQVPLIINFNLPAKPESYIHRTGHGGGGRLRREGVAINLVTAEDVGMIHEIEQFYSTHIEKMPNFASLLERGVL